MIGNFFLGVQGAADTAGIGGFGTAYPAANAYSAPLYGTSAIDSTVAQNLVVTYKHTPSQREHQHLAADRRG